MLLLVLKLYFLKIIFNILVSPNGVKEGKREMTNKSKRAVSAMSDDEFDDRFPDEKAAIDWFIDIRYKGNLVCPHCGTTVSIYSERARLILYFPHFTS